MGKLKILYFHQHFSTPAGKTGFALTRWQRPLEEKVMKFWWFAVHLMLPTQGLKETSKMALEEDLSMGLRSWNSICLIQMTKVFSTAH